MMDELCMIFFLHSRILQIDSKRNAAHTSISVIYLSNLSTYVDRLLWFELNIVVCRDIDRRYRYVFSFEYECIKLLNFVV